MLLSGIFIFQKKKKLCFGLKKVCSFFCGIFVHHFFDAIYDKKSEIIFRLFLCQDF